MLTPLQNAPSLWLKHLPTINVQTNKYTRGHALVFGGYPITGAARLSALSAARVGVGLTTIAVSPIAFPIYATALTSIMVTTIDEWDDFDALLADERISAFLIGPGAGVNEQTRTRTTAILATSKPTVLDADALTSFQNNSPELFTAIQGICVLTPHEGEFKRLFNIEGDRLKRATLAAEQSGAIIVLKGSQTIIAAPDGRIIINSNAPPTLATAGSGDVLNGMILGLLAQGMDAFLACAAAVWLHGEAANYFGVGLIADDLPDLLPLVLGRLTHFKAE